MLDQLAVSTRIPSEFVGLARVFRNHVKLVDQAMDEALHEICNPLRERLRRHPKLRAEMLPDIARRYDRLIPAEFRIGKIAGSRHKTEFAVVETRACVSWLACDEWDPEHQERGLAVCKFTLSVHQSRLRTRWTPLCNVSLHALARRVERHQDRSHAALWRDVALLADADDAGERIDTPGGFWLGGTIAANGEDGKVLRIRSIRTWIDRGTA